jgi:hypothetical protein
MNSLYRETPDQELLSDDIAGVLFIYGSRSPTSAPGVPGSPALPVPEPVSLVTFGIGVFGLTIKRRHAARLN